MIFTFILLFISILFGQYIAFPFLKKENYQTANILSIIIIAVTFIISNYLTYYPMENFIFWDPQHKTYSIVLK